MGKDVNKRKSMRHAKVITELCISAVIIGCAGYAVNSMIKKSHKIGQSDVVESSVVDIDITEPTTEPEDPNKIIFESLSVETKSKFKGDLILVNNNNEYFSGHEELVAINEMNSQQDSPTYVVGNDNDMKIINVVYQPLISMMRDFNAATGYDDIVVIGGFRTAERQKELYDEDLEQTGSDHSERVALPGHSEHESGYAMDFTTSTTCDYDGTGKYDWINQNCWKYGFILRYPEDKTSITQIQYKPWHYRYVGVPHAYYMYKNGLCLEEYIDLVRTHTYEGEHLKFTDDNGNEYEVYFSPSDDGAETTFVPVPSSLKYDISGNNSDGFIVTVYVNESADNSAQQPTEAPSDDTSSTEEASAESTEETTEAPTEDSSEASE